MMKQKIFTIVSVVILVLQILAEAFLAGILIKLDMLPIKYLVAAIGVFLLLAVMTGGLLFLRGSKPVSLARRIVGWVLAVLVLAVCLVAGKLAYDAYHTIGQVTTEPTSELEMYVLVRDEDPAAVIADVKGYPFGIIADYDEDRTQQAIVMVEEATGEKLKVTAFERITEIADGLLEGKVDAVIMNGAAITILTEDEVYEDFLEKARILHTFQLEELEVTEPTEPETEPVEDGKNITNTPFVVYCSGSDTRSKKMRTSRSDVNILVIVNPQTKQILMINTPRDYYVENPHGKNIKDKLTNCGLWGAENSMKALGKLYGLEVKYYAKLNFTGFETLIDAIGGITVHSDKAFPAGNKVNIKKGENHLNGYEALCFARDRYHAPGGDRGRGKNQMKVIKAVVEKMTTGTTLISGYSGILSSLEGMFKTNVTSEEISMLVKMQLSDMASWSIFSYAVDGTGGSAKTYSSPGHNAYVMYPNQKMVDKASSLAKRVLSGEVLTSEDLK